MSKLNSKKYIAAAYIAQGRAKKDTAQAVGVAPQTVSSWMQQKPFTDTIAALRTELIYATRDRIRGLGIKATKTLDDLMDNGSPAVRLAAARDVLDRINLTPGSAGAEMGLWAPETRDEEATLQPFLEATEEEPTLGPSKADTEAV